MKRLRSRIVFAFVGLIVSSIFGFADTNVSGIINVDTTWTKAESPYIVTDSIVINQGKTLTIEPGVVIKFEKGKSLRVDGTLIARGTTQDKITFTSNADPKNKGDWGAISFTEISTEPSFDISDNYLSGSILENCKIEYGGNTSGGVLWFRVAFYVKENIIENNLASAIYAEAGGLSVNKSKILKNIISNNAGGGIFTSAFANLTIQGNLVINNNIENQNDVNTKGGIYVRNGQNFKVCNNILVNNISYNNGGLSIFLVNEGSNNSVTNNFIMGNKNDGGLKNEGSNLFVSCLYKIVKFLNNTIKSVHPDNGAEIVLWDIKQKSFLEFHNNNIFNGSSDYSMKNSSIISLDVKSNWWGTINEQEIKSKIFDWYDDASKGIIEY